MSCSTGGGICDQQYEIREGGRNMSQTEIPKLPRAMCRVTAASRAQPLPQRACIPVKANHSNWHASHFTFLRNLP